MILSWQKRRGEFNHDWMKNRYLPALGKLQNLLDDFIEDDDFLEFFFEDIFPEWEFYSAEGRVLIERFEIEMSPRSLIDYEPFTILNNETRAWLSELVHHLWLMRYPVRRWIEDAFRCISDVDDAYEKIIKLLKECPDIHTIAALKPTRTMFEEYRNVCMRLAKAFEKFPSRILVT